LNRTKVELKHHTEDNEGAGRSSLNRTKVELKQAVGGQAEAVGNTFESNQSGIETETQ